MPLCVGVSACVSGDQKAVWFPPSWVNESKHEILVTFDKVVWRRTILHLSSSCDMTKQSLQMFACMSAEVCRWRFVLLIADKNSICMCVSCAYIGAVHTTICVYVFKDCMSTCLASVPLELKSQTHRADVCACVCIGLRMICSGKRSNCFPEWAGVVIKVVFGLCLPGDQNHAQRAVGHQQRTDRHQWR